MVTCSFLIRQVGPASHGTLNARSTVLECLAVRLRDLKNDFPFNIDAGLVLRRNEVLSAESDGANTGQHLSNRDPYFDAHQLESPS
mmetsp:Transcript_13243/g.20807  ORF Transcript_13243/g.20807 Transcript_13243/m.20807 type:complete len:86 (+) Transcript_13243:381-638(+)